MLQTSPCISRRPRSCIPTSDVQQGSSIAMATLCGRKNQPLNPKKMVFYGAEQGWAVDEMQPSDLTWILAGCQWVDPIPVASQKNTTSNLRFTLWISLVITRGWKIPANGGVKFSSLGKSSNSMLDFVPLPIQSLPKGKEICKDISG